MPKTKAKHTPQPWTLINSDDGGYIILSGEKDIAKAESSEQSEEEAANARLIAASPDLLSAAEEAVSWLGEYEDAADSGMAGLIKELKAAIRKAEEG